MQTYIVVCRVSADHGLESRLWTPDSGLQTLSERNSVLRPFLYQLNAKA